MRPRSYLIQVYDDEQPVPLSSVPSMVPVEVDIVARPTNTNTVYLGDQAILYTDGKGHPLEPGEHYTLPPNAELHETFITGTAGDGVTWIQWHE